VVKEMKYRPKIGHGDFDTKTRKVEKFLGEGHKVKVTIMFRGREMQHPELGKRILDDVAAEVIDTGRVEVFPKLDGRNMTMVLAPDKKAQAAKAAERKRDKEEAEAAGSVDDATAPIDTDPPITEIIEAELDANLATDGVAHLDPEPVPEIEIEVEIQAEPEPESTPESTPELDA